MNPLLFADWGRMNRLFTKIMWAAAAIMICVVFVVLASAGPSTPASPAPRSSAGVATASHADGGASADPASSAGTSR